MIHPFIRTLQKKIATWLALTCLVSLLGACSSVFNSEKVNYKSQASALVVSLEIPPDLTQLNKDTRYRIPGEQVSANAMGMNTVANTAPSIGATKTSDVYSHA